MRTSSTAYLRSFLAILARLSLAGLAFVLVLTGIFSTHGVTPVTVRAAPQRSTMMGLSAYARDRILVGMKPGGDVQTLARKLAGKDGLDRADAPGVESLFSTSQVGAVRQTGTAQAAMQAATQEIERVYRLHLPPGTDVWQALEALRRDPQVAFAEPDYQAGLIQTPDDPLFASQWALAKINAPAGWDVSTGSSSMVIAIIDSGIDLEHQDLTGKLWTNSGEIPDNGLDDDGNGKVDDVHGWNFLAGNGQIGDDNGHGTQVAGVLAAQTNNAAGIAGMCWNCQLMILKVVQASGVVNYSDIAAAVSYAAAEGAKVINLSLGGYADSQALRSAIESASTTALVVAGAGNDNKSSAFYPAAYPDVIAVAATDQNDVKADFSDFGAWVDVSAPGVDIQTTLAGNNAYGAQSGTSLAAPFVSGLAGLLRSSHADWSPALVKQQMLNTSLPVDPQNPSYAGELGSGRIDAGAALTTAPQEQMSILEKIVDGQAGAQPAPGQTFDLVLALENEWLPARNLVGTISENDSYTTVPDSQGTFGDVNTNQQSSNSSDPFQITLAGNTPYNRPIPFTLQLSGSDGYALTLSFTLTVRSGTYEISGNICTQNWTSDKNYVLIGNTIVSAGCTLTISPGVQIKADAGIWMRVDGTLVAEGTEGSPVTFTTNAADGSQWTGLRFIDSSGEAVFDGQGNYLSGSLLRYVKVSAAQTGVSITTHAPYIAHSIFEKNGLAVNAGSSSARIEYNTFWQNGSDSYGYYAASIFLNSGSAYIAHNTFTENGAYNMGNGLPNILSSGGGVSAVIDNDFAGNTGTAMALFSALDPAPIIHNNRVVGNGGGFSVRGFNGADISGNLISGNLSNNCEMTPCQDSGGAALSVDIQGPDLSKDGVRNNTLIHNQAYGLIISGPAADQVTFAQNNWLGNEEYDVYLKIPNNIEVSLNDNYWNGLSAQQAEERIYDCEDTPDGCSASTPVGNAVVTAVLDSPDQTAPAFVLSTSVAPDPLGVQQGVFDITFSKAMDTSGFPSLNFHDARKGTLEPISAVTQSVTDLAVDASGRMWVGTTGGAQFFDGESWTTYNTGNTPLYSDVIGGIFVASNGDVWFTTPTDPANNNLITRLRGTVWQSFAVSPFLCDWYNAIGEDPRGNIWFGGLCGTGRFGGTEWTRFQTDDGLLANDVGGIARDGQGHMWFAHNDGMSVYDGSTWTKYPAGAFLPDGYYPIPNSLFADSQGRIWIGLQTMGVPSGSVYYAGMYDGAAWTFYGPDNTDGLLRTQVNGFSESSQGEIWMLWGIDVVITDGANWRAQQLLDGAQTVNSIAFDSRDNLWIGSSFSGIPLHVLWGGQDFPVVDNGQWLTPTQYRATYNVTPIVPMGTYAVQVEGAAGIDGMLIAPDDRGTFQVSYASTVIDDTPPSRPNVQIKASSTDSLSFGWSSSDPQGIYQYRYCIGTEANRCDVLGWKYTAEGTTSINLTGLLLTDGGTYYVSVAAQNTSGLWSAPGSAWVKIGQVQVFLPLTKRGG